MYIIIDLMQFFLNRLMLDLLQVQITNIGGVFWVWGPSFIT